MAKKKTMGNVAIGAGLAVAAVTGIKHLKNKSSSDSTKELAKSKKYNFLDDDITNQGTTQKERAEKQQVVALFVESFKRVEILIFDKYTGTVSKFRPYKGVGDATHWLENNGYLAASKANTIKHIITKRNQVVHPTGTGISYRQLIELMDVMKNISANPKSLFIK